MTTFQQLHQTAPETKGRGDCYYANLKESSLTWTIILVLSRIELTPSIFKAPNLTRRISIFYFFFSNFFSVNVPFPTIWKAVPLFFNTQLEEGSSIRAETSHLSFWVAGDEGGLWKKQNFYCSPSSTIKKKKIKSNVQSSLGNFPCGIDGRSMPFELKWLQVLSSMAKMIIVTRNTGSKGREKLSDRGCVVITWQNTYQLCKLGLICE